MFGRKDLEMWPFLWSFPLKTGVKQLLGAHRATFHPVPHLSGPGMNARRVREAEERVVCVHRVVAHRPRMQDAP